MPDYKSIYSGEQIDLAVGKVLTPDAAPTTNSQNLVTSGGVKAAIDNATAEFGDIETRVESIEGKIPSGASSSNKLATASDVAAKYTKPGTGIPASDLASAVQTSLGKADSAYQKPVAGIPKTDLASGVQLSLQKADEAAPQSTTYTKTEVDERLEAITEMISTDVLDLSHLDSDGIYSFYRNTANCYVVRRTGTFKFPLVYGNAIKNNMPNAAAYTRQGSDYTADFVNHLGNTITSPYIESNANCSAASVGLLWQTDAGDITSIALTDGGDCRYITFNVGQIPATNGIAVLYVKDANDAIMWSWMIWLTSDILTPEITKNYTSVEYPMMPEGLGTIWSADRTRCTTPHYQWGRKDPMAPASAYNSASNHALYKLDGTAYSDYGTYGVADDSDAGGTTRSVANAIQMPNKFFLEYDATKYNWNNLAWFNNFWNAAETASARDADNQATAIKTIYDPSPAGWMLPGNRFATGFTTTGGNTSTASQFNVVGSWANGWQFKRNSSDTVGAYYPAAGRRYRTSGALAYVGSYGYYWSCSPFSQTYARFLSFNSGGVDPLGNGFRAYGFSVRPCRELN